MTLEVPSKDAARMAKIPVDVSTKVDGEKRETQFEAEVPATLADAIAVFGEKGVFRMYMQSLIIKLQGEKRQELAAQFGGSEKKERVRARWIDELGL